MHRMRHGLLAAAGSAGQQQRLNQRRLARHRIAKRPDRGAVAEQRTVNPPARVADQLLRHAQLALERRRPLGDTQFKRSVQRLELFGAAAALFVKPRVVNGAGNLVGDDRDQRAVVLAERAPHRALDREHADQIVADHEGNRELALRVRQAGNGNRVRDFSPAAAANPCECRRSYRAAVSRRAH